MAVLLPPGSRVGIVFPSHPVRSLQKWEAGLAILRDEGGYEPVPLEGWDAVHRVHAGDDEHRSSRLMAALTAPDLDAVWMGRGGSGLTRLLPRLALERVPADRPVLGFSDGTALFLGLRHANRGRPVHAPVVHSLSDTDPQDRAALFTALHTGALPSLPGTSLVGGDAEAHPVLAGNLTLLAATCGTPWQLDASGHILLIEEVGEPSYRVDRLLVQLVPAGVFEGVAAIGLGEFAGCRAPDGATWSLTDLMLDVLGPLGIPIVGNLPFGHAARNAPVFWDETMELRDGVLAAAKLT